MVGNVELPVDASAQVRAIGAEALLCRALAAEWSGTLCKARLEGCGRSSTLNVKVRLVRCITWVCCGRKRRFTDVRQTLEVLH
jgi:hypothetical protein